MTVKNFQQLTGKHLNFFQKLEYRISRKRLKNEINTDGTIENKVAKNYVSDGDHSTGLHLGFFLLGMTIIGVLVAYMLPAPDDETKKNRVRWAWRGALFSIGIAASILAATGG